MLGHVAQAVIGQALPQRRISIQPHDCSGEGVRIVGDAHILAIAQVHAFHRAGGADHRLAVRHAEIDLAFHARAKTQRRHRDTCAVHERNQIRNVTMQLHAGAFVGQQSQGVGQVGTDAVEDHLGQLRTDLRKDVTDEPLYRIHIRRMTKAADEDQVAALREAVAAAGDLMQVGQQGGADVWRIRAQLRLFCGRHQQGDIGGRHDLELAHAGAFCATQQIGIAGQLGTAAFAQVMQVDGIEQGARLARILPEQRQAGMRHVVAHQQHHRKSRTMVGHRCRGARVNDRIVPLTYRLRSGDRVEIMTAKEADPRRDWLLASNGFLASGRSRDKVRAWFHKLDRARNVQAGKDLLDRELKRLGLQHADLSVAARKFHAENIDELYIQVALGDTGPNQVSRALLEAERAASQPAVPAPPRPTARRDGLGKSKFTVEGVGNLLVQLARCCQPVAGEPIAGYLTRGRGITVHRTDCAALARLAAAHPQRVLPVEWGKAGSGYEVDVQVRAVDRRWLLKDITNLIAQEDAHVLEINSDNVRDTGRAQLRLRLKVSDYGQLSGLLGKLDALPGVSEVRRLG